MEGEGKENKVNGERKKNSVVTMEIGNKTW